MAQKAFLGWPVFIRPCSLDLALALAMEGTGHWLCPIVHLLVLGLDPQERRHGLMSQLLAQIGAGIVIIFFVVGMGSAAAWSVIALIFGETPPVELEHED